MRENIALVGIIDVYLINSDGEVVKHVTTHNQITEAFARWLLLGNLGVHESNTIYDVENTGNAISHFLYSSPYQKTEDPNTVDPNLKEGYQIAVGLCGVDDYEELNTAFEVPRFAIYALNCDVDIHRDTYIPPIFNPDLATLNTNHVVCYSNADQPEDYIDTFTRGQKGKRWSRVRSNPIFTTSYMRSYGEVTIKSIVLASSFKTNSKAFPCITIRQSPTEIPEQWEAVEDELDEVYLIAPFIRSSRVLTVDEDYKTVAGIYGGERYGDGLYGVGYKDGDVENIAFWEYGSRTIYTSNGGTAYNVVLDENFSVDPSDFINDEIAGGFAIGNGKAIRVNNGGEEYSNDKCIGRSVEFITQERLYDKIPTRSYISPMLYASEDSIIPEAIYKDCPPVMVAKRGDDSSKDRIEIFVSMGVGTFTEYTDENGFFHPGGTGVEIHKLVLYVDYYRYTVLQLDAVLEDYPEALVNYGRVAVLPYAIGYKLNAKDDESGEEADEDICTGYLVGTYDVPWGIYYLPITHILSGVDTLDWSFDGEGLELISCATERFQPGVVYYGCGWDFIRPCILGVDNTRIAHLSTIDGYLPIAVNRRQRWSTLNSMLLSGMSLPEAVTKKEDQRLVINYSYGFEIIDEFKGITEFTIVDNLVDNTVTLTVTLGTKNVYVSIYRAGAWEPFRLFYGPSVVNVNVLSFDDGTAVQAKKYIYRANCFNGAENSEFKTVEKWTPYRGASHSYLVCFDGGSVDDIPAVQNQMLLDLSTGNLYIDERAGIHEERWYSTGEIKDGVFSEFPGYDVREVNEEYLDQIHYENGVIVICPERRRMYLSYNGELISINGSDIKRI